MDDLAATYHEAEPAQPIDEAYRESPFRLNAAATKQLAAWPLQRELREALSRLSPMQHQAAWRGAGQDLKRIPDLPPGKGLRVRLTRYLSRALATPTRCPATGFVTCGFLRFKRTERGLWIEELFANEWKPTPTPKEETHPEHHALRIVRAELERLHQALTSKARPYTDPALYDAQTLRTAEFAELSLQRKVEVEQDIAQAMEAAVDQMDARTLGPLAQSPLKLRALAILGYPALRTPQCWRDAFHRAPAFLGYMSRMNPKSDDIERVASSINELPPYLAKSARRQPNIACTILSQHVRTKQGHWVDTMVADALQLRAMLLTAPERFKAPANPAQRNTASTILVALCKLPGAFNPFDGPTPTTIHALFDASLIGWHDPRLERLANGIKDTLSWAGIMSTVKWTPLLRGMTLLQWCALDVGAHEVVAAAHGGIEGDAHVRSLPTDVLGKRWLSGPLDIEGHRIVELGTAEDLRREGDEMEHCVGGYARTVDRRECVILSIRSVDGEERSTCQLVNERGVPTIRQLAGVNNAAAVDAHHRVMHTLLNQVTLKTVPVDHSALIAPRPASKPPSANQVVVGWLQEAYARSVPAKDKIQPLALPKP